MDGQPRVGHEPRHAERATGAGVGGHGAPVEGEGGGGLWPLAQGGRGQGALGTQREAPDRGANVR